MSKALQVNVLRRKSIKKLLRVNTINHVNTAYDVTTASFEYFVTRVSGVRFAYSLCQEYQLNNDANVPRVNNKTMVIKVYPCYPASFV